MKKFLVPVQVLGQVEIEISAKTKKEALQKASERCSYKIDDEIFRLAKRLELYGQILSKPIKSKIRIKD